MKHQILRRAGALVLALAMVMTMSLPLIAPAWAADEPELTVTVINGPAIKNDTIELIPGETATLMAGWVNNKGPVTAEDSVEFLWTDYGSNAASIEGNKSKRVATVVANTGQGGQNAPITVTAQWIDSDGFHEKSFDFKVAVISTTLKITRDSNTVLRVGGTTKLGVEWTPRAPRGVTYKWTGGDEYVTFDNDAIQSPTVTAVGKTDNKTTVTVTASWGSGSSSQSLPATYDLTVDNPTLMINGASGGGLTPTVGDPPTTLEAVLSPAVPPGTARVEYTWTSSDTSETYVKVAPKNEATATVTAVKATGENPPVTITVAVSINGKSIGERSVEVTVNNPGMTVTSNVSGDLAIGDTRTLTVNWNPQNRTPANATYTWSCKPEGAVTFDGQKTKITTDTSVTAKAAEAQDGPVEITVTATWDNGGEETATYDLTVVQPELTITQNGEEIEELSLATGETTVPELALTWKNKPLNTVDYSWPEDSDIVQINKQGEKFTIKALSEAKDGTEITVTATWDDGSAEAKLTVKITNPILSITNSNAQDNALTLTTGDTAKLVTRWNPASVDERNIEYTWTSSDPAYVTVTEKGEITAVKATTTPVTITATPKWTDSSGIKGTLTPATLTVNVQDPEPAVSIADSDGNQKSSIVAESTVELKAILDHGPGEGTRVTYTWTATSKDGGEVEPIESTANPKVTAKTAGTVEISVTAKWGDKEVSSKKSYVLTITEKPIPVTGVKLDPATLTLAPRDTAKLTPVYEPENATINKTVTWKSSDENVVKVISNGTVTALAVGEAVITATVKTEDGKEFTATCTVTVSTAVATGITFGSSSAIVRSRNDPDPWDLTVNLLPAGSVMPEGATIEWSVEPDLGDAGNKNVPKVEGNGRTATVTNNGPGNFVVTAKYKNGDTEASATQKVIISGILLTQENVSMLVGENRAITVSKLYGFADDGSSISNMDWTSSDSSVVSVVNGELTAWQLGTVTITANRNGYKAECVVVVKEDDEVIADKGSDGKGYTASPSKPLILSTVWAELNQISKNKTGDRNDDGTPRGNGVPLDYINNVTVSTSQGTLYYNYNSEANTGAGVGTADRFTLNPGGTSTMLSIDKLYFVPKQGFKGVAEITFNGWPEGGNNFSGIIRVNVGVGENGEDSISYGVQAGEPVWFLTTDFNAYCQNKTGRDLNYVTFNLPQTSQGVLYYNYVAGTGSPVTTTTQFSRFGKYTLGDVCFVPDIAFTGEAAITFRGVDTSGAAFDGTVKVNVTPSNVSSDPSNVNIYGQKGKPVTLRSNLFNDACKEVIQDTLAFVTFKLPDLSEGTLYYNYRSDGGYESRVNATTRYYFSGVPGISGVTFVPASGTVSRVAIPYTGYGSTGTTFNGTLYINLNEEDRSVIRYTVPKNGSVAFSAADFDVAGLYRIGDDVDYVVFNVPDTSLGTLYYNYRSSTNHSSVGSSSYYVRPSGSQRQLGLISFHAGSASGTVIIPYTAYSGTGSSRKSFTGSVVIQVGAITPADVNLSCYNSGYVRLYSSSLSNACYPAMGEDLAYIEITNIPDAEKGHLYLNYYGFGTGTEVKEGDRFYYSGSPGIDQLSFVPRAGFAGEAEITYIGFGYSGSGTAQTEQVSGRILVNVVSAKTSQYFNDMSGHVWAIDSVDYLRQNRTVEGVGGGRYNPTGIMTKGDFAVMLVRAYGLTASGSVSFDDVPAGTYYADAVRVVALLGIADGSNGKFNPKAVLSRQDAMVMIYNTLKLGGKIITNGLAADFSGYRDNADIAPYAREAMGGLMQMGIVKGNGNGLLRPLSTLTRAETAVLLHSIMTL